MRKTGTESLGWSPRARWLVIAGLAVLAIAVTLAAAVTIRGAGNADARAAAGRDAQAFAVATVPTLLSYEFDTVDAHFEDSLKVLGGDFRDEFKEVADSVIIPSAHEREVVTAATLLDSAVVSATKDKVELLMFINQTSTNSGSDAAKLEGSRVRVAVEKSDTGWIITELAPL